MFLQSKLFSFFICSLIFLFVQSKFSYLTISIKSCYCTELSAQFFEKTKLALEREIVRIF